MSSSPGSTEHMVNGYAKAQFYSLLFKLHSIFSDLEIQHLKYCVVPNPLSSVPLALFLQNGIFLPHPQNSYTLPPKQLWLLSASQTIPTLLISERKYPPPHIVPCIRSETMACQALLMVPKAAKWSTRRTSSSLVDLDALSYLT